MKKKNVAMSIGAERRWLSIDCYDDRRLTIDGYDDRRRW